MEHEAELGPYGRRSWIDDQAAAEAAASPNETAAPEPAWTAPSIPLAPPPAAPSPPRPLAAQPEPPTPPLAPPPQARVVPQSPDRVGVPWARRPWDPQPVSPQAGDWWAPSAVNPHPPARAVAELGSYQPYRSWRLGLRSPWKVVDRGSSVVVSARRSSSWPRRDRPVLVADGAGLDLVGAGDREPPAVRWEHIAQLVSLRPPRSGTEAWYVERLDGTRLPLVTALLGRESEADELRSILLGVAWVPTRFDLRPIAVDGAVAASPGRYPESAPVSPPPTGGLQNENVF